jgi:hypothetical protein
VSGPAYPADMGSLVPAARDPRLPRDRPVRERLATNRILTDGGKQVSVAMRALVRRFLLGHGPLKRRSDRLQLLCRVLLLASALAAVPIAVAVGASVSGFLHATAARQAAERHQETATLLADAPAVDQATAEGPSDGLVLVLATWTAPHGHLRQGHVLAPAGSGIGTAVRIWVDARGAVTTRPLPASDVTAQVVVAGSFIAVSLPSTAVVLYLFAVWAIDGARERRWAAEWAVIEPLWAGRTH